MKRSDLSLPEKDSIEYILLEQALMLKEKGYFPHLSAREIVEILEKKNEAEKS